MEWSLYIAWFALCVCVCWTIWEAKHAPHKPKPEETKDSCCYNCLSWFEEAGVECCELSGLCAMKSTGEVNCYTTWNYVCDDYSGTAPKEEKHE